MLYRAEPNRCDMTYMYEYPQYIPIPMEGNSKYKLIAYGEGDGKRTDKQREEKFDGIPVLFIAGNAGSSKQVRSLASVALRKSIEDHKYKIHFEWSAFHGGVLEQQSQFEVSSIERILGLYRNSKVQFVVLVDKSVLLSSKKVELIINLATPDTPVVLLDRETQQFYEKVSSFWSKSRPAGVTLVTISGGLRDLQVRSGLTQDPQADIQTSTSAIPGSWVSADHKCIVWCKQLVLTINRALFDMVDSVTRQISVESERRLEILHYHLVNRAGGKKYDQERMRAGAPVNLEEEGEGRWTEITERQRTLTSKELDRGEFFTIELESNNPNARAATLEVLHTETDDWLYGCLETKVRQGSKVCSLAESLSAQSVLLPSKGKRKMIQLDLELLSQKYSDLVINLAEVTERSRVNIDLYNPRERSVSQTVPKWINFWRSVFVLERTVEGGVYYNISLSGLELPWQSYTVTTLPVQCSPSSSPHYGLARLVTPWSSDVEHSLLARQGDNTSTNTITARIQASRPTNVTSLPAVELFLDPACRYTVKIQPSMPSIMGQMVRFYSPLLIPCMVAINILILAFQFRRLESDQFCQSTLLTLLTAVSPINVVLPSKMLAYVLAQFSVETDINIIQNRGQDFGVLPIMMFFISIGLMFFLICAGWGLIVLCGSLANKALTTWAGRFSPHEVVTDLAVSSLAKFPAILATLLVGLGWATCGSLGLCLGCFCYFLKLFSMYREYLEGLVKRAVGIRQEDDPSVLLGVSFQFSLALLWLMNTVLSLPVLMTWSQNLSLGAPPLPSDPSLPHLLIMAPCLAVLWQNEARPRVERKYFSVVAIILHGLALAIATFAMVSLYRIPFIITACFLVIALHQLLSPVREEAKQLQHNDDLVSNVEEKKRN